MKRQDKHGGRLEVSGVVLTEEGREAALARGLPLGAAAPDAPCSSRGGSPTFTAGKTSSLPLPPAPAQRLEQKEEGRVAGELAEALEPAVGDPQRGDEQGEQQQGLGEPEAAVCLGAGAGGADCEQGQDAEEEGQGEGEAVDGEGAGADVLAAQHPAVRVPGCAPKPLVPQGLACRWEGGGSR
eukprot:scaffold13025_cov67-Isochrysis_galbana.AAC.1